LKDNYAIDLLGIVDFIGITIWHHVLIGQGNTHKVLPVIRIPPEDSVAEVRLRA
jgi:hypothetical protein